MALKKIYCRVFQACFGLGARLLPWRRPTCIAGAGSLQRLPELLKSAGCHKPMIVASRRQCDALTHAVEAYTNVLYNTRQTRELARQAVAAIFEYLPRACADGTDLRARQEMLTASYRAGFAFTRASVGNVHALAHTLGGLYNVLHGRANAVLLPVMLEEYGPAVYKRLAELADVVGLCPNGDRAEKARAFIGAIYDMNRTLGIPTGFDCIRPEDLPQMAAWAEVEANPVYPVPVVFGEEDFIRVARRVMQVH